MPDSDSSLYGDFESASLEDWRAAAEAQLRGRPLDRLNYSTDDGFAIQPLYTDSAMPEQDRGALAQLLAATEATSIWQEYTDSDPKVRLERLREGLGRGVHGARIEASPSEVGELEGLLDDDVRSVPLSFESLGQAPSWMASIWARVRSRGIKADALSWGFGFDPLGVLATRGEIPFSLENAQQQMLAMAQWSREHAPRCRVVRISLTPYENAGASRTQQIAIALATGATYLRWLCEGGVELESATPLLEMDVDLDAEVFSEIAKLRALRLSWAKLIAAWGGSLDEARLAIHARTSARILTVRDPWVNFLRATSSGFVARVGGADSMSTPNYDEACGTRDPRASRWASHIQVILDEEAHLSRSEDPASGCHYLDSLTHEFASRAWGLFREIEKSGGIAEALRAGSLVQQVEAVRAKREKAVATRRKPIVGVSEYAKIDDDTPPKGQSQSSLGAAKDEWPEASSQSIVVGPEGLEEAIKLIDGGQRPETLSPAFWNQSSPTTIRGFSPWRMAEPFEDLRARADQAAKDRGQRPCIALIRLAPAAKVRARELFVTHLAAAGGFEAMASGPYAEPSAFDAGASLRRVAVLCGEDETYAELVPPWASHLKVAGYGVYVAGRMDGDLPDGVRGVFKMGSDALQILNEWMTMEESV